VLPIHLAAELFPLLSTAESEVLGEDIKKNGLAVPLVLWQVDKNAPLLLLDGRNRLDAMEAAGLPVLNPDGTWLDSRIRCDLVSGGDPYAQVVCFNLHRRHLTPEQRRELIAKVLMAGPEASNRQIAESVKVDHKTVASVRAERVATGEIPQLKKTKGKDGKSRPTRKKRATEKVAGAQIDSTPTYKVGAKPSSKPGREKDHSGDHHLQLLGETWSEVAVHIASGNRMRLKAALAHHLSALKKARAELEGEVA
jgi:hypothetical protein